MSERNVYGGADLQRLIDPRVIAVVGASERPGSFGERTIANLDRFAGRVYGVNPNYREVAGRPCVPSLRELPESPDCIALCVARPLVEAAVRDAIAVRAGGVIVYASGFAETGLAERKSAQEDLARLAQEGGPNRHPSATPLLATLPAAGLSSGKFTRSRGQDCTPIRGQSSAPIDRRTIRVGPGKTILDALLEEGVEMQFSCTQGVFGTCETRVLSGTPIAATCSSATTSMPPTQR